MNKKDKALLIFSLGLLPFVTALVQFIKKGSNPDAPVIFKDLLIVLGLQLVIATLIAIRLFFFNYAILK